MGVGIIAHIVIWKMGSKGRIQASAVLSVALALVACSCGGSSADGGDDSGYEQVFAAIDHLHGKKRTAKLVELAQAEGGELNLYTSANSDVAAALEEAFSDAYDIDVSLYRANTEAVAARLSEEASADFRGADVTQVDGVSLFNLERDSLLVDYRPDALGGLVAGADQKGWTVSEYRSFVVGWNTKLVEEGTQPRSWEDLADPRWKGKLVMEFGDFEWYGTLREYWIEEEGKSEAEADRLFAQMGRNARVLTGHTLMTQLLAAGEFDVAASAFASTVDEFRREGASISWRPAVEPVVVRTNGVALVREPRNPAAAVLYLEWLAGHGQKVLAELGREPARKDLVTLRGAREIRVDYARVIERQDEWRAGYERILKGAERVPEEG